MDRDDALCLDKVMPAPRIFDDPVTDDEIIAGHDSRGEAALPSATTRVSWGFWIPFAAVMLLLVLPIMAAILDVLDGDSVGPNPSRAIGSQIDAVLDGYGCRALPALRDASWSFVGHSGRTTEIWFSARPWALAAVDRGALVALMGPAGCEIRPPEGEGTFSP